MATDLVLVELRAEVFKGHCALASLDEALNLIHVAKRKITSRIHDEMQAARDLLRRKVIAHRHRESRDDAFAVWFHDHAHLQAVIGTLDRRADGSCRVNLAPKRPVC